MNRPADKSYTAYTLGFREMEERVRSGELENYDWGIHYDDASKIFYEVRIWLSLPDTNRLSTASPVSVS